MKHPVFLAWCGVSLIAFGVIRDNEIMLATGIILCAVDYSADRVIDAIIKRGA